VRKAQYELLCCWCVIPLWLTIEGPHVKLELSPAQIAALAGWRWDGAAQGYACVRCQRGGE